MAKLTAGKRNELPEKDFAVAGRKYPVNDKAHAKAALSRVSANGTSTEKAEVRRKVRRKYPSIKVTGLKEKRGTKHRIKHKR